MLDINRLIPIGDSIIYYIVAQSGNILENYFLFKKWLVHYLLLL